MKLFKKTLALLLAAALCAAALSGCKSAAPSQTETDDAQLLDENGKPVAVTKVLTVDGDDVSLDEFRYYFMGYKNSYEEMLGGAASDSSAVSSSSADVWAENPGMADMVKEQALNNIVSSRVIRNYAKQNGIELTDEDQKQLDDQIANATEQNGGEEGFQAALKEQYLTPDLFRAVLADQLLQSKIQNTMLALGSRLAPTEEEVQKTFNDTYIHAKHILISTQGLTEQADIDAKKATADEALARAKAGEDFDALVEEYGEDPGMKQSPDGYYFGEGEMVTEFYDGSKALEIDGISDLVKSDFGWHIIQRLPIGDAYYEANKDSISAKIIQSVAYPKLMEELNAAMENAKVEKDPSYELINVTTLK